MNKKGVGTGVIVGLLAIVAILLVGAWQFGWLGGGGGEKTGRVVFAMTDATANMSDITSIKVTVDSVDVHTDAEGWTTVSTTQRTYDLLELKANNDVVVLADVQLKEGTYQQVRLDISKVVVTDSEGDHEAKLPSNELKIVGGFEVKANTTSSVMFDFIADESIHVTGNGQYVMAPVCQYETRTDADVEVKSDNKVTINNGKIKTNIKVGMDITGAIGVGKKISATDVISVNSNGGLKIGV